MNATVSAAAEVTAADRVEFFLRLGDNPLVLSQRLSEWCGKGPAFEEDMALTNVALDLLGQARMWLTAAGQAEGAGRDENQIAFLRDANQFRNLLLVEQPNGDYATTLVRQLFFDVWHALVLQGLLRSTDDEVAAIAGKALKEVDYHRRRTSDLIIRLGDGTDESNRRVQTAINRLWQFTGELFAADALDERMAAAGLGCDLAALQPAWEQQIASIFAQAKLTVPAGPLGHQRGGRQGRHTEKLGYLLAEMQFLQRAYPGSTW